MTDPDCDAVAVLRDALDLLREQLDHVHRRNDELTAAVVAVWVWLAAVAVHAYRSVTATA